jgi:hypothetical protein
VLTGTSDLDRLDARAPVMESLTTEPVTLEGVEILHLVFETSTEVGQELLPPALDATAPPLLSWVFWRCPAGPFGSFELAQARLGCRSGVRPRALLMNAFIDSVDAGASLTAGWGFGPAAAEVRLRRHYDDVEATVIVDGSVVLHAKLADPQPLGPGDVHYTVSLHAAHTPAGLRLVQVDPRFEVRRAERGRPRVLMLDPAAWGDERLRPTWPVSASLAVADITLPRLRYLCRPDVSAFVGTEHVGG